MENLLKTYESRKSQIAERLEEFRQVWDQPNERIFAELCFCLCTPQSKATRCWAAVSRLFDNRALFTGSEKEIEKNLAGIRFPKNKSTYITGARPIKIKDRLKGKEPGEMREWLVQNIRGFGYKEASHFLRNVGFGESMAILDRHILKNLARFSVIEKIPKSLTRKKYLEIEDEMKKFSEKLGVPMAHLDLLLWSLETGEIFK